MCDKKSGFGNMLSGGVTAEKSVKYCVCVCVCAFIHIWVEKVKEEKEEKKKDKDDTNGFRGSSICMRERMS